MFIQSPNFLPAKHSRYTVLHVADKMTQKQKTPKKIDCCVLVIPQDEYNILVITQVRGEAEDAGDNKGIVRVYWGIAILYPTHQSPVELLSDVQTFLYS